MTPRAGSFARGVLTLASGTAGVQALYVVSLPIVTRLYTVPQMGDLTVFQALLAVLLVVSALRYEVAIFVPHDEGAAINVLGLAIWVIIFVTTAVAGVLAAVASTVALPAKYAVVQHHWFLLCLGLFGAGLSVTLTQWTLRRRAFAAVARARVSQVGSQLATQLTLGAAWPGGVGLLVGDVAGRMTSALALGTRLVREDQPLLAEVDRRTMVRTARELSDYPLFSMPGSLLNAITLQLPPLLLLSMFGQHVAGWFGLMIRVVSAPMMLIGKSVSDAYASEFSKLIRENPAGLPALFLLTFRRLALIGLVPMAVILAAGPWLFQVVFGGEWREAGVYARYAAFYTFAEFCCYPLFLTLNLLEKQRLQFLWDAILILLLLAGFWAISSTGGGARTAVLYYALCFACMYFAHVAIALTMLRRMAGVVR